MCRVIEDHRSTADDLTTIRTKHLRAYLLHSKAVSRERLLTFSDKDELIRFIQARRRNELIDQPTANVVVEPSTKEFVRLTLDDLTSLESIEGLTIRQLKDLLRQNFVSIKGCLEKRDLIDKVQLLFQDHQQSHEHGKRSSLCFFRRNDSSFVLTLVVEGSRSDDNLCKVCLDAPSDCVFLDCAHLCTCVRCGKRLSECPLCRSYIVRVVRIFKG